MQYIRIDTAALRNWLTQAYSVALPEPIKSDHEINVPFVTGRAKTGSLVLASENKNQNSRDPFDRPEPEIRSWVQGIIWRDEHFRGKPLQQIARREGVSHTHILKYINKTLEVI